MSNDRWAVMAEDGVWHACADDSPTALCGADTAVPAPMLESWERGRKITCEECKALLESRKEEEDHHARWERAVVRIREVAEPLLVEFYGKQHKDYESECIGCQRWRVLDDLTANPFDYNREDKGR